MDFEFWTKVNILATFENMNNSGVNTNRAIFSQWRVLVCFQKYSPHSTYDEINPQHDQRQNNA